MVQETRLVMCDLVPEAVIVRRERKSKWGSVSGLSDEELASPAEIERQAMRAEFEPLLTLPDSGAERGACQLFESSGGVKWGSFGTVEVDGREGRRVEARYKKEMLREQLKDVLILFSIVSDRLPGSEKHLVLKYVQMGIVKLDHIKNHDMRALAKLYLRAQRLRKKIAGIEEWARRRVERRLRGWLEEP